tara:strand:- start:1327 stop:2163 length:837 start_codon:yes stop_codon:yes gene_type:complete
MALKRLLVPLDPSAFADGAVETACRIAQVHQARIAGIAVLDSPEIRSSIIPAAGPYYPMMVDEVQAKVRHADKVLTECIERFVEVCDEAKVPHIESEYEGIPAQKLLESSIFYDLIVMGLETSFHFETRPGSGDTLDKLLNRTSTPVLAVPPAGLRSIEKVTITFDGSFSASRALRDFMVFAKPYNPAITLITSGNNAEELDFLLKSATDLLSSHSFTNVETISSRSPIDEAISGSIIEESDLIVAGIHSKNRVKDFFVGSFTLGLIERGDTALFLSH